MELSNNTINKVVLAGFRKRWVHDKSSFYYEKMVKHPLVGKICVTVDVHFIAIDAYDKKTFTSIHQLKNTPANLNKVLKAISNNG